MDRERHTELLEAVQRELEQPIPNLNLPIAALRKQIAEHVSDRVHWYAFPEDPDLSDARWTQLVLPGLLKMGASGGSDRMRAQLKMVEVMYDPDRELRGFLDATRDSDEYIALRGLVALYIERTQSALRKEGLTTVDLWRRGQRNELYRKQNEARSWTSSPTGADTGNYEGDTVFRARVPVEHIAAFRNAAEQEVLVSRESLDDERNRLHLVLRKDPGRSFLRIIRDWRDERRQ